MQKFNISNFFILKNKHFFRIRVIHRFSESQNSKNAKDLGDVKERPRIQKIPKKLQEPFYIKHKLGISLIAFSALPILLNFKFFGSILIMSGFCNIFVKENGFLRIYKLYVDLNKNNDMRMRNLNEILVQKLIGNEDLRNLFTDETSIGFSQGMMVRDLSDSVFRLKPFAKPEDSVEHIKKKYNYRVKFFDLTTGTFGEIIGDCVYNHDQDYYFRKIIVDLFKPVSETYLLEDSSDTIDI